MALTPQIDGNIISLEQTEKVLPSKTYKINNDVVSTEIEIEEGKPTVIESDEMITIDDLSYEQISLNIKGNSWQETRSGKNLFDKTQNFNKTNTSVDDWTITQLDTGVRILSQYVEGSPNIKYHLLDLTNYVGKTVRAKSDFVGSANNQGKIILGICDKESSNSTKYAETTVSGETISFVVPELEEGKTLLYVILYANYNGTQTSGNYVDYTNLIITIDNEDMTYEPYGVMPSPEFRSKIRNVGDNVNEFDVSSWVTKGNNSNYYSYENGELSINVLDDRVLENFTEEEKIYLPNGNYCLSNISSATIRIYNKNTNTTVNTNEFEVTLGYIYLKLVSSNVITCKPKIEKGSKATPYSPYNCGNANITVCNVNFFDKNVGFTYGFINSSGTFVEDRSNKNVLFNGYINVEGNKDYTFGCNVSLYRIAISEFKDDKTFIKRTEIISQKHLTITTDVDTKYLRIVIIYGNEETTQEIVDTLDLQLELGSKATEYIPHQSQQFTFPLSEGQRMYKDSYLADDGVHHKRKQVILSKASSSKLENTTIAGTACKYATYVFADMEPQGNSASKNFFCDRVMFNQEKYGKYKGYLIAQVFVVLTDLEDTIENLNSVMEGAILEYPLAEEIIEPYIEEQQKVYNEINDILIESSVINIFSNDEIKPFVKVIYFSADNIIFNTGEKDRIIGYADGLEAIKQAIYHILNTERYAYLIYDDNYGVEFEQYIGKDFNFIQATIEDTLREALTHDLRITDVMVNSIDKIDSNVVAINFTATTVYGDLVLGVNINV